MKDFPVREQLAQALQLMVDTFYVRSPSNAEQEAQAAALSNAVKAISRHEQTPERALTYELRGGPRDGTTLTFETEAQRPMEVLFGVHDRYMLAATNDFYVYCNKKFDRPENDDA